VVAFLTGFSRIAPEKPDISNLFEKNGRFAVDYAEVMARSMSNGRWKLPPPAIIC